MTFTFSSRLYLLPRLHVPSVFLYLRKQSIYNVNPDVPLRMDWHKNGRGISEEWP